MTSGLISYLASYAKINEYGFVEAPYRKVKKIYDENGNLKEQVVTDEVEYMTADVEDEYVVAQANEPLDETKHFKRARVSARRRDDILEIDAEKVDYMDVSPRMMVSVATACIPFLENDDCNRALMGSNMQRQAVRKRHRTFRSAFLSILSWLLPGWAESVRLFRRKDRHVARAAKGLQCGLSGNRVPRLVTTGCSA